MSRDPLTTPVQYVKGVGPHIAALLEKRGIATVADLLYTLPFRYIDRRRIDTIRSLTPGSDRTVIAQVVGGRVRFLGRGPRRIYELTIADDGAMAAILFFHFRESWLKKRFPVDKRILVHGECQVYGAQKQFVHPEIEDWEGETTSSLHPIVPVYPLTEGLYQRTMRRILGNAVHDYLPHLEETPFAVRATGEEKISLREAIEKIHFPPDTANIDDLNYAHSPWHQRVLYDEIFYLQLGLLIRKRGFQMERGFPLRERGRLYTTAVETLPFRLTGAQKKVLEEIHGDLSRESPMNRLLQGDVGSGKTLVAFLAAVRAAENGFQTAIMAPTEILAQQHALSLKKIADRLGVTLSLLTHGTPPADRELTLKRLRQNEIQIAIGTHALIQEGVEFASLALVVIDEQQRFGVSQRALLKGKSEYPQSGVKREASFTGDASRDTLHERQVPHVLVMSATPIPRTLAMTLYGDLDISVMNEHPHGRTRVTTHLFREERREECYAQIRREIAAGRQAYFIYPLIEQSEKSDLKNVTDMAAHLKEVFPKSRVELLHGRLKDEERERVMADFKQNRIAVLVSTTVVEVGVDVPNATIMVIEHAERFGLSQLHQLRGRIGRGGDRSFCFLIAGYAQSEESRYRLKVMESTQDGFVIAEEDLKLRGSGDIIGTRQSGLPTFHLAQRMTDSILLDAARRRAGEIVAIDPVLEKTEHKALKKILLKRWEGKLELATIS